MWKLHIEEQKEKISKESCKAAAKKQSEQTCLPPHGTTMLRRSTVTQYGEPKKNIVVFFFGYIYLHRLAFKSKKSTQNHDSNGRKSNVDQIDNRRRLTATLEKNLPCEM